MILTAYHSCEKGMFLKLEDFNGRQMLWIDNQQQYDLIPNQYTWSDAYHDLLFVLPVFLFKPHRILVLGGGDFIGVDRMLDINPHLDITLVDYWQELVQCHYDDYRHKYVKVIIQDAREFIKTKVKPQKNKPEYDLLIIDFPDPIQGNSDSYLLYSKFIPYLLETFNKKWSIPVATHIAPETINDEIYEKMMIYNAITVPLSTLGNFTGDTIYIYPNDYSFIARDTIYRLIDRFAEKIRG